MRVTNTQPPQPSPKNLLADSARELAKFIKLDPEQHRKIAQLICSIGDRLGKQGIDLLQDFVKSSAEGTLNDFMKRWSEKRIPMSILSDLLAISQEMEANTREKVDALILKAKRGALELGKQALKRAILLVV